MKTFVCSKVIVILLAILYTNTLIAQDKEKLLNLSGDWKFSLGDNMKFAKPEYDDSDWEKIYVPSNWQREGFRNYHGFAWYRKKVTFDYNGKDALFLELGKIDDVDEVYINGNFIGRTGGFPPTYFTAFNYPRRYAIPTEYLNKNGKNVIAVRVYDEGGEAGIMGFPSSIGIFGYGNYSASSLNLFGEWKFKLGDDKTWAAEDLNEVDWETVIVPSTWESQGFEDYDGFGWYRKTFRLSDDFKTTDLVLLIGKIDDLDEVYLNGKLIGSTGRIDRRRAYDDEWQKFRTYVIPEGVLKPGRYNVIAVRVFDETGAGGIYEGPVALVPKNEYRDFWRSYRTNSQSGDDFFSWLSYFLD